MVLGHDNQVSPEKELRARFKNVPLYMLSTIILSAPLILLLLFSIVANAPDTHIVLAFKPTPRSPSTPNQQPSIATAPSNSNTLPIANAGADYTVFLANGGEQIIPLDGSKSSDANGHIVSYAWKQIAGPACCWWGDDHKVHFEWPPVSMHPKIWLALAAIQGSGGLLSSGTIFKYSLTVTDDKGAVSNNPAIVTITIR